MTISPSYSRTFVFALSTFGLLSLPACDSGDADRGEMMGNSASGGSGVSGGLDEDGSGGSGGGDGDSGEQGSSGDASGAGATGASDGASGDEGSGESKATDGEEEADADSDDEPRFDVAIPDAGDDAGGFKRPKHSYIWIANSAEGTISKVDTQTVVEKARYMTAPAANNPSRTSIDLSGNAAVSGRAGGITKIFADPEDCTDKNGNGSIETSTDKSYLPFAQEECIAWHVATPYAGQRGTAWTQGFLNPETGKYEGQDLWVASLSANPDTSMGEAILYDGDTGAILGTAAKAGATSYGGAVDENGDFWYVNGSSFLRVADRETFAIKEYPMPHSSYGITVGGRGYVWTCYSTIGRFDPKTETWESVAGDLGMPDVISSSNYGGCMVDAEGVLWHSGQLVGTVSGVGIFGLDAETMTVVAAHELPEHTHGIAIDFDGYVWGIGFGTSNAYKVHPETGKYETFADLVGAYTYSDMTGFALASTAGPVVD